MSYNGTNLNITHYIYSMHLFTNSPLYMSSQILSILMKCQCLHLNNLTRNDMTCGIKKLSNKITVGIDIIPRYFIKDCSYILIEPFYILFNIITIVIKCNNNIDHYVLPCKLDLLCNVKISSHTSLTSKTISILCLL